MRLIVNTDHTSWEDDSTGPKGENTEEAEVKYFLLQYLQYKMSNISQTIKSLWKPNLEIYGLEDFQTHKILGEMAGLRVTNKKIIKYDMK